MDYDEYQKNVTVKKLDVKSDHVKDLYSRYIGAMGIEAVAK